LTAEEQEKLKGLRSVLVTEMNLDNVILLLTSGCISDGHLSAINAYTTQPEMIGELLNILICRSFAQYKMFEQFLRETCQTRILGLLESYKGNDVSQYLWVITYFVI